ncbi:hypothetical protein PUNSTDRAFT_63396 [Punctularia strigosozonata HHB-11173 SS5]|uniref:uncharacterized protein n=1 Tax=Punctularia strigosozonata (strain HHB-11173) TaxID=741275 RepID=UPI0004418202|nr:uncharacterized protein PUNSTDRAFT_63396 [Punctularia strigosozonata HHB-11173 SS5]EIN11440.1 hypothetical protein PUNSTDRAFT_63396 [Punctularia strigosozonata HHB-11173 SS5]
MADVYRVIIDDTSPVVYYAPLAEPLTNSDPLTGWVPFFTDSGFPTSASLGDVGNGTSYHVTSLSGAQLSVQWFGTGIQLFGNATGASYDILVDGKASVAFSSSLDENVLAAVDDLKQGNHTISLVARPDTNTTASSIAFDRATATISAERAK